MLALCAGLAAAAARDNPQVRLTRPDQQLARSILPDKDDLPDVGAAWKGGTVKPTLEGDSCGGAKNADLILSGSASSSAAFTISYSGSKTYTVASVSRLPFPRLGEYSDAYRVVLDYPSANNGKGAKVGDDYIDVNVGRVEASLVIEFAYADRNDVKPVELELAKLLLARSKPPKIIGYQLVGANVRRMQLAGSSRCGRKPLVVTAQVTLLGAHTTITVPFTVK